MKTLLLTGAAGFIGFHTAQALAARGDHVIGIDNFNDYYSPKFKQARSKILKEKGIEVIEGDINDRSLLKQLFEQHPFTHVINFAAQAGVRYARKHPEAYLSNNIDGFLSVLETLRHHPHVKLLYASSSSIYGCNTKIPFSIDDVTDQPANLYAATKKANELMAYCYNHLYGISCTGLRFFTVYGPWGRPDMAYFSFTEAMLADESIRLFNNGEMERDFTYIDDAVRGTLAALDLEADCEVFNIGNNQPVALLDFVSILEKELGIEAKKIFEGPSAGEVKTTFADISHSQKHLNYKPLTSLEEGLSHFLTWHKSLDRALLIQ